MRRRVLRAVSGLLPQIGRSTSRISAWPMSSMTKRDGLDARPDPAAFYFTGRFQLFDDRPRQCRGNRKSDTDRTTGRRENRRVDADHLAG